VVDFAVDDAVGQPPVAGGRGAQAHRSTRTAGLCSFFFHQRPATAMKGGTVSPGRISVECPWAPDFDSYTAILRSGAVRAAGVR
jgi:hypothetical protein